MKTPENSSYSVSLSQWYSVPIRIKPSAWVRSYDHFLQHHRSAQVHSHWQGKVNACV